MNNIGLLTVRLEPDVLRDALDHHAMYLPSIVALCGDPVSAEVCAAHPAVVCVMEDGEVVPDYGAPARSPSPLATGHRPPSTVRRRFCDACRQPALDWIRREHGAEDTWVTLLHADERWFDSPLLAAEAAQEANASYILWGEFRFFLHTSDRGALAESLPLIERVRWCAGPFFEVRQFRLREHQRYLPGKDHQTLPVGMPGRRWSVIPRYRHYPYRSEAQAEMAYADKYAGRYWQPDHGWLGERPDPYVDALPAPQNSPLAAWSNVFRHERGAELPDPAKFLPEWWEG